MSKKIIIPKGLVNPNETTIIEIPAELAEERELIASPTCPGDCSRRTQSGGNYGESGSAHDSQFSSGSCTSGSPSFRHPQASSTHRPKDYTYTAIEDSSIFNTGNLEQGTFESCDSSFARSTPPMGQTFPANQPSTESIEEYEETTHSAPCGTTKVVKKTSKTFLKQPMQPPPCGNTFARSPEINKTRAVCPALQSISSGTAAPQAMYDSSDYRDRRGCGVRDSTSSHIDRHRTSNAGAKTFNMGRARSQSPRGNFPSIETTESYMETVDGTSKVVQKNSKIIKRMMDHQGANGAQAGNRTFARSPDQNRTRDYSVFHPTITSTPFDIEYSSIYDSSLVDLSTETSGSSTGYYEPGKTYNYPYAKTGRSSCLSPSPTAAGRTHNMSRTQNMCPAFAGRTFSPGRGRTAGGLESLSIGAPQATSTPQANLTYSQCVDSSLFKSHSFDPNTFGTMDSSEAAGGTFNYGRTHAISPSSAPAGRTYNMGRTHNVCPGAAARGYHVGKSRSSTPINSSIGAPQATSTPQANLTYTQMVDSSLFKSHSFEPGTFGSLSSSYPDSGAMLGRTYNAGKSQNICPGAKPISRSYTKITKKSSKTFDKPPGRNNDIGTLGAAYINSTRPSCAPNCPNNQRTYSKPEPSAANQTRMVIKKTSKTTMKSTAHDGTRTKTIQEVTSVESMTEGDEDTGASNIEQRLAEMEHTERSQLAAELKNYQDARRNLMTNTTYNLGDSGSKCDPKCQSKK